MTTSATDTLTLLYTSDVHGHMLPLRYADNSPAEYGLLKLASIVKQVRKERRNALFRICCRARRSPTIMPAWIARRRTRSWRS